MIPVERNALLADPILDPTDKINTIPKEIFIAHILPHLNEAEYTKAHLVSKQWSVITEDFRTSLVHRARRGEPMTAEQWLIISQKNRDLAELFATLYSFIKKCVEITPAGDVNPATDVLSITELIDNISKPRKYSDEDLRLLNYFLESIFCYCFERICGIKEWQESFFDEVLADNLAMSGLMGVAVKIQMNERMEFATSVADLKERLLGDVLRWDVDALMTYGFLCENGNETLDIAKDKERALYYYKQAAERGCEVTRYYLGCCYIEGHLVEKDMQKAISFVKLVAKEGEMPLFASISNSFLAYCYAKGLCGVPDIAKAFEHMQLAAKKNSSMAELYLGFCYASGYGVEQNWDEAFMSFVSTAVHFQDPYAYLALGCCFLGGKGIQQNAVQASACFKCVWDLLDDREQFMNAWAQGGHGIV